MLFRSYQITARVGKIGIQIITISVEGWGKVQDIDLDDMTSPIEAGLGWITKFAEGKNFINRPMLEKQKAEGTVRKLVGFEMVDRGIPRHGYELFNTEGEAIGVVTSGTMSPTRKIGIGMGYVKPEYSKVGTEICIDMRGRKLKAVVVRPPFRK